MSLFGPFVDKLGPVVPAALVNQLDLIRQAISAIAAGNVTIAAPTSGGHTIAPADLTCRGVAICKFKSAATGRNTTTTMTNDPDLVYAVPSAGTYAIMVFNSFSGQATGAGGIKLNVNYSGSFTSGYSKFLIYPGVVNGLAQGTGVSTIQAGVNVSSVAYATLTVASPYDTITFAGSLIATGAGNLAVAWAQSASNADNTYMLQGSYLRVTQLM
jgi:hypothetical protein